MSESAASRTDDRLLDDFEPSTPAEWRTAAERLLRGASFEKRLQTPTPEGITLRPIYGAEDVEGIAHLGSLPGAAPFVRGSRASGYLARGWAIEQEITAETPAGVGEALREAIAGGQDAIHLVLDPAAPRRAPIDTDQDLSAALEGVDLATLPIWIRAGASGAKITNDLIRTAHAQGVPATELRGGVEVDPLGSLVERGRLDRPLLEIWDELATRIGHMKEAAPGLGHVGIRGEVWGDAGASAVQELAFVTASLVAVIRACGERGVPLALIGPRTGVTLTLGSPLFTEIAKLRAMRLLWARVVRAFDGDPGLTLRIRGRSTTWNRSTLDPHVNALRATTEAFAGVLGSVDGMQTGAFDEVGDATAGPARRLARNTQLVLRHETQLTPVVDPVGGSWYVEALTDELARGAWALFQRIESEGGMTRAIRNGLPQRLVDETVGERRRDLATARTVMVGVNRYAPPGETSTSPPAAAPSGSDEAPAAVTARPLPPQRAAEPFEALRRRADARRARDGRPPRALLVGLGSMAETRARADFSRGFLEVGGFEVVDAGPHVDPIAAARTVAEAGVPIVVLCSTDDAYGDRIPPFMEALSASGAEVTVAVAGRPGDREAADREAGVHGYLHLGADLLTVLHDLLDRAGAPAPAAADSGPADSPPSQAPTREDDR